MMKVTITDVAKKAGVSKTTVSRIINHNYAHTTEETRQRVLDVIKELDYRPNALAKGLKSSQTNVIGMVLSNLKNPFWTSVLEGVEDATRNQGFHLMICNSDEEPEKEEQYIREFRMRQVDGIVINPTVRNPDFFRQLVDSRYPLVVINRKLPGLNVNNVVINNVKGASMAVRHLLNNGKRNIAAVTYRNEHVSTWKERIQGYRTALLESGYAAEDLRIVEAEQDSGKIKEATLRFLREHPDTDAVFSTNNMITLEVMDAIRELGLSIPERIAVVGYDETVWAKHLNPPLTTIRQPGYQMGQIATNMLIESIRTKNETEPKQIVLEPELIVRRSSGAAE
ncbi:transcriptional regulator [Paenibacillus sp. 32O-W]|uniref:LacI family DNA-binding transcriptional regulator n=1 Tax=Paenibacillus sp. 32O-W TaxID=1695218 RepID=UPI0007228955|nr:substrate-binding domain-containing protein [Paenibacillus sp. 32O-W]ALS28194.1 transcriptional regulator [Paenibacillus sp. 32O-W]